ncbi:hypothetical protein FCMLKIFP_00014 [Pseudomonas phage Ka3]|uniref:Uncharacterized protein n=1 Tax=Pseudomonas phage KPP21 TaxID=1678082 RepID=A0A0H5AY07_BPK21|nr:hypothetical protein AVU12_gp107 [Pseudomonas phage KPP21]QWY17808.1 hypothetical protein [Pseudomonas phage vB_Pae-PA152]UNI71982.1 hypothetical protein [Pseudomonas phage vB_PaeP_TUMS_P10]WQZ52364.1 hypothetical protein FCMLKIFP_00014 [Pseudomonas phage Ka3]BAR94666.1 hypothetical protein [Pseudomonas phage KPP21]
MKVRELLESLNRMVDSCEGDERERLLDHTLRIPVLRPGMCGARPAVDVVSVVPGFDWDNGSMFVEPKSDVQLTVLTPEQIKTITASYAKGTSWFAYQETKKLRDEILRLRQQLKILGGDE